MRYPILWERTAPDGLETPQWDWADERLAILRDLAICPIVGLTHHGCGPHYATFDQPGAFEDGLSNFAGQVAARYPWVDQYTPVNEPLTTANRR